MQFRPTQIVLLMLALALPLPLFLGAPAALKVASGFVLAYYVPGIILLGLLGNRDRPRLDDLFLPLVLSPIIAALLVLGFHAVFGTLSTSVKAFSVTVCLFLAGMILTKRFGGTRETSPIPAAVLIVCVLFGALVIVSCLVNGFLMIRSDSWYHASVVNEILDRGIPPREPWLPDMPIRYMWTYHLFVASSMELTGLPVFPALMLFNVVSAFVFPYLVARLAAVFTRKRSCLVAAPLFAIAGLASSAWILWPLRLARAFTGQVRGLPEVGRILGSIDIKSERVLSFLSPFSEEPRFGNWMVSMLDKFLTVTAFGYVLDVFLLFFITIVSTGSLRRSAPRPSLFALLLMVGALLFHVVLGTTLILAVIGAGIALMLIQRIKYREMTPWYHAVVLPCLGAFAVALVLPYLMSLTRADGGGSIPAGLGNGLVHQIRGHLHFGTRSLFTIAMPLAILYRPTRAALADVFSFSTDSRRILGAWIGSLFLMCLFIDLPTVNESKLIFPLFLLLVPPVAVAIVDALRETSRRKLVAMSVWLAILFAVPAVLTVRGFILDKPLSAIEAQRYDVTEDDRRLFEWIRSSTPANAVIVESEEYDMMPVYAHRRDVYPTRQMVTTAGYRGNEVDRCLRIGDEMRAGEPFSQAEVDFLESLGVEVLVVLWQRDIDRRPSLEAGFASQDARFEKVYENSRARVYALRGTRRPLGKKGIGT